MTKTIAIIILFVCSISIQAQTKDIDKQLLKKYSKKELTALKTDNPAQYKFDKYCINNAFYIFTSSKEKTGSKPDEYGIIKIKDLSNVNFFELKINLKQSVFQAFIIEGTSKVIMIKSKDLVLKEIEKK